MTLMALELGPRGAALIQESSESFAPAQAPAPAGPWQARLPRSAALEYTSAVADPSVAH